MHKLTKQQASRFVNDKLLHKQKVCSVPGGVYLVDLKEFRTAAADGDCKTGKSAPIM